MAYQVVNPIIGMQPLADTSTTKNHVLGTMVDATDVSLGAGEFIYLEGVASTVLGSFVTYNAAAYTTALLAANAIGPVAVAMAVNVAGPNYGWYQISGKAVGKALAEFADNGNCYATVTAGSIDDAVVAGDLVRLCKGASAVGTPSTGLAYFEIHRPFVDDDISA